MTFGKRDYHSGPHTEHYPHAPSRGKRDSSALAAEAIEPVFTERQQQVICALKLADMTNSEIFQAITDLSDEQMRNYARLRQIERGLQPRAGELEKIGKVFDTGERRTNPNGREEIVWSLKRSFRKGARC